MGATTRVINFFDKIKRNELTTSGGLCFDCVVSETKHIITMTTKYRIYDTFNRRPVSGHRSLKNAVIAEDKFSRSIRRHNGSNNYIPTRIELWDADFDEWVKVPTEDVQDAEQQYLNA